MPLPAIGAMAPVAAAAAGGGGGTGILAGLAGLIGGGGGAPAAALLSGLFGGKTQKTQVSQTVSQSSNVNASVNPVIAVNVGPGAVTNPSTSGTFSGNPSSSASSSPSQNDTNLPAWMAGAAGIADSYGPSSLPAAYDIDPGMPAGIGVAGGGGAALLADPLILGLLGVGAYFLFSSGK